MSDFRAYRTQRWGATRGARPSTLAQRLGTSRTEIYRVADPENNAVSLATLKKAAAALGKRLRLDLVDAG